MGQRNTCCVACTINRTGFPGTGKGGYLAIYIWRNAAASIGWRQRRDGFIARVCLGAEIGDIWRAGYYCVIAYRDANYCATAAAIVVSSYGNYSISTLAGDVAFGVPGDEA